MSRKVMPVAALILLAACGGPDPATYPDSPLSFRTVDRMVGCDSRYSDDKKENLFEHEYKNKWYRWSGKVIISDSDSVQLDMNGGGTQELDLEFDGEGSGYDLLEGQEVTVRFVLDSLGGCILPFGGKHGRLVVDPALPGPR